MEKSCRDWSSHYKSTWVTIICQSLRVGVAISCAFLLLVRGCTDLCHLCGHIWSGENDWQRIFFGNGVGGNVLQYILAHSGYDCVIYISISITTDGYMFVVSPSRIHSLNCRLVENFPQISYSTYADRFHCCHHVPPPPPPPPTYSLHTRARNTVQLIVRSRHFFATYKSRKDII